MFCITHDLVFCLIEARIKESQLQFVAHNSIVSQVTEEASFFACLLTILINCILSILILISIHQSTSKNDHWILQLL